MKKQDFELLDRPGNLEKLIAKGYQYIIPGDEFTASDLEIEGHSSVVFVDATPVKGIPEDGSPYLELNKESVCDAVLCYIVDEKYFD